VVVADVIAPDDDGRARRLNEFERLCDSSHVRTLTEGEFVGAFDANALVVVRESVQDFELPLDFGGRLTEGRKRVLEAVEAELAGGPPTELRPFRSPDGLKHRVAMQLWVLRPR
jgi:hypothetical protein